LFDISERFASRKEAIEDVPSKVLRERAERTKFVKKTNVTLKKPHNYGWRFPLIRFNKHFHRELKNLINDDRMEDFDARWDLLYKVGKHPSPETVEIVVDFYSRKNRVSEIPPIIKLLENDTYKLTRNTFYFHSVAHIRNNDLDQAEKVLQHLKTVYPEETKYHVRVYGAYISYFWRTQDRERLASAIEELESENLDHLSELEKHRYFTDLLTEIPVEYLREEPETFISILSPLGENNVYDFLAYRFASEGLTDDVKAIIGGMEENNTEVTAEVYDSLILSYIKNNQLDEALQVLENMRQNRMQICLESYCDIIRKCIDQKRDEEVHKLLSEVKLSNCEPTAPYTLTALTKFFAEKGDYAKAKKYWYLARDNSALTNPADSHPTIALTAKESHGTAFEMYTYLSENFTVPLPETFDAIIAAYKENNLSYYARVLEQHKFRSYN